MSNGETPGGFQPQHANFAPDSAPTRSLRFARDLHVRGRLIEAERAYRETLEAEPDRADALHLLGVLTAQRGDYRSAVSLIIRAAGLDPSDAAIPCNLGNALRDSGRLEEALVAYGRALKLDPLYASALKNRGGVFVRLGRFAEGLADCDKALPFGPEDATLHATRGNALLGLDRADDALESFTHVLALKPGNADALFGRGRALSLLQRPREALADSTQALVLSPDSAAGLAGHAKLLLSAARHREALAAFDKALEKTPDEAAAHRGRADALFALRESEDAAGAYDKAFALDPTLPDLEGARLLAKLAICDWSDIETERARLLRHVAAGHRAADPFAFGVTDAGPREQLLCAQNHAAARYPARNALGNGAPYHHRKIRIGYVAGEQHRPAHLFQGHDRDAFELHAYAIAADDSAIRASAGAFSTVSDVANLDDREIAERIRSAEIDILVDLDGYARNSRPGIFTFKPSPVQVNYGFAGTMGAPFMDYILADTGVIPKEAHIHYSEKVVTLPDCGLASDANRATAPMPTRAELGLPRHGVVFACFNDCHQITPDIFSVWMRLLAETPNSVLWLTDSSEAAKRSLVAEAAKRNVAPERLIFAPNVTDDRHLARLALADIYLDTLPINARNGASDALCAGVPVLTCPGRTFASRIGASLNRAAKLDDMVVGSLAEYEALALKFARKPLLLSAIRKKLAMNRKTYPLFDTAKLTRNIEAAYRIMWERAERGEAPTPFSVGPDGSRL